MTQFTAEYLSSLRNEINEALELIGKKHNISIKLNAGTYSGNTYSAKLSAVSNDGVENVFDPKLKMQFDRYAALIGLKTTDYGRQIKVHGHPSPMKLIGITPKSKDIIAITDNGKRFRIRQNSFELV